MANRSLLIALLATVVLTAISLWLLGGGADPLPNRGEPPGGGSASRELSMGGQPIGSEGSGENANGNQRSGKRGESGKGEESEEGERSSIQELDSWLKVLVESETGDKLAGVKVSIRGKIEREGQSKGEGVATFEEIPAGTYQVVLSAIGFPELQTASMIRVSAGEIKEIHCVLRAFDAKVSGRVMDSKGSPMAGVTAHCESLRPQNGQVMLERIGFPARGKSDGQGRFEIAGLASGEYVIQTEPQSGYSQTRQNITAPSEGVLLVMNEEQPLIITGIVKDQDSRPLAGVAVSAASGTSTETDADGRYRLSLNVNRAPGITLALSAGKPGYTQRHKTMALPLDFSAEEVELAFKLEALRDVGTLVGTLHDSHGNPVPGESIYLQSASRTVRLHGSASSDGTFQFDNLGFADDYVLSVYPSADFWDKSIEAIKILGGANQLEVALEPVEKGSLNATLVDTVGKPVSQFTVWVKNLKKRAGSTKLTSDNFGRIYSPVPAGDLVIETRGLPKLTIRGLRVALGEEVTATIPIGLGNRKVRGQVRLPDGLPVAGARVIVTWSQRGNGFQSSLFHEALSDTAGNFEISGFGPGDCAVSVSAVGVNSSRLRFQIPREGDPEALEIEIR